MPTIYQSNLATEDKQDLQLSELQGLNSNSGTQSTTLSSILTSLQSLVSEEDDPAIISALASIQAQLVSGDAAQATSANQVTALSSLASILSALTGVSTSANQVAGNNSLSSILSAVSGVATASNQATANASLASILTRANLLGTEAKQDSMISALNAISAKMSAANAARTQVQQNSTTAQVILAANASRKGFLLYNDTGAKAYLAYGAGASASSFTASVAANSGYTDQEATVYTGQITALWASGNTGFMRITELT